MLSPKKKGLLARTRYESDLLIDLLPAEFDSVHVKLRRYRQESRAALKAVQVVTYKILHRKWINQRANDMIYQKFALSQACLEQSAVNIGLSNTIRSASPKSLPKLRLDTSPRSTSSNNLLSRNINQDHDKITNGKLSGRL